MHPRPSLHNSPSLWLVVPVKHHMTSSRNTARVDVSDPVNPNLSQAGLYIQRKLFLIQPELLKSFCGCYPTKSFSPFSQLLKLDVFSFLRSYQKLLPHLSFSSRRADTLFVSHPRQSKLIVTLTKYD